MEFVRGIEHFKAPQEGVVATIGNFDGVHMGHRALIKRMVSYGQEHGLASLVMIFEPQPLEFFAPEKAPTRLFSFPDKADKLAGLSVDYVLLLPFNETFSEQTPEQFIVDLLVNGSAVKHLIIGDDFRFGKNRKGDFSLLQKAGQQYGFSVEDTQSILHSNLRVSSTRIRQTLETGDFKQAEALLGAPYSMKGEVIHGKALGRTINVPTANISTKRLKSPLQGVFAVSWQDEQGDNYQGIANLGTRPTVDGEGELLEVHLFDCDKDLYGRIATVTFLKKLRNEQRFSDFELLKIQIGKDIEQAQAFFKCYAQNGN
ncbi:MAG: bifunctional riboflavin kinase/FAD synthetase [Pseudomonadales bacterium]|nr:bifunctional riboflavin kinase/FAD synthetase [Pseudomonadales bacterium]